MSTNVREKPMITPTPENMGLFLKAMGDIDAAKTACALMDLAVIRVPQLLGDRHLSVTELAKEAGVNPEMLKRWLRLAMIAGYFEEDAGEVFRNNTMSRVLGESAAYAAFFGSDPIREIWTKTLHTLQTGQSGVSTCFPDFTSVVDYMRAAPQRAGIFYGMLNFFSGFGEVHILVDTMIRANLFEGVKRWIDVGCGDGSFSAAGAIRPELATLDEFVLVDRGPSMMDAAKRIGARARTAVGDVRQHDLPLAQGPNLLTMKWVCQDFGDGEAGELIRACASTISRGERLCLVESMTEPGRHTFHYAPVMNLIMAMHEKKAEVRTKEGNRSLLENNGFNFERVIETPTETRIFVGRKT